ncbi:vacuolar protein sorting-associated protein 33A [Capsaspora owczarzaki ATCC 30864]|uniref:Vacuolar protein sorting-associated protein 33A, variant n=1 Tax=Capsaspora owczarzaki (strain ATCC 30864) TaxID=595528 RepID=A0A0D2VG42_CAPO3|nr:vacuolar protein sorting-associated protein 33A [Capsaspora owczarzaki ATCC 30864]KJE88792.1 vacuolar protein sorting-associated protein 33A, variant [Capsaspora owczarzaki ATCC 30864]|eukprot:XP_004365246.1 vacuolar protein sorting-associated protein 33A [Capsaspora owczarzaki ATCC 30864]
MSTSTAYLSNGALNLNVLRDFCRRDLLDCIDSTPPGKKVLIMDEQLVGPLGLIAEYSLLKEHGVEKLFLLTSGRIDTEISNVIFITRPKALLMERIASVVRQHHNDGQRKDYHVFFAPRKTLMCERILETEGVLGDLVLGEYQLDILPYDSDLLSLEMENSFRECNLDGDPTSLFYVARSIMKLQTVYGIIPQIVGKGPHAKHVAEMMLRLRRELATSASASSAPELSVSPEIDTILLIDRTIDLVTPLCTQLTYEGLLDESFSIEHSFVTLNADITGNKDGKKTKVPLNSSDRIFSEIRDLNFAAVGPLLSSRAKSISQQYDERHDAKTVGQIKDFIGKLPTIQAEHQSLRIHTNIAEQIMKRTRDAAFLKTLETEQAFLCSVDTDKTSDYIEDLIGKKADLSLVLRLIALQSLTNGGFKPKVLDYYRREILHTYGMEQLVTLANLEKTGLLRKSDGKSSYPSLRKALRLVVEDVNQITPNDISYTFSGYAPISVRLVEAFARSGWRGMEEVLRLLPGPTFEELQMLPPGVQPRRANARSADGANAASAAGGAGKVTLVFFVGGCSYAEVAAIRFLAKQQEGRDYIIATTHMLTGGSMLQSVVEPLENRLVSAVPARQ